MTDRPAPGGGELHNQTVTVELPPHLLERQMRLATNAKGSKNRREILPNDDISGGDWDGQSVANLTNAFWSSFDALSAKITLCANVPDALKEPYDDFHDADRAIEQTEPNNKYPRSRKNNGTTEGIESVTADVLSEYISTSKLNSEYEILLDQLSRLVNGHADILSAYDLERAQKRLQGLQVCRRLATDVDGQSRIQTVISGSSVKQVSTSPKGSSKIFGIGSDTIADSGKGVSCAAETPVSIPAKRKFAFKNRAQIQTSKTSEGKQGIQTAPSSNSATTDNTSPAEMYPYTDVAEREYSITRRKVDGTDQVSINIQYGKSLEISLSREELSGDVCLSHLRNCTVHLNGRISALQVRDVVGCQIYTGVVTQSVMIFNTEDSCIQTACGQLRIHDTTKTDLFLLVTSHPIIEHCSELRFGKYTYDFKGNEADIKARAFDRRSNLWKEILDFNWQHPGRPSPNWKPMVDI